MGRGVQNIYLFLYYDAVLKISFSFSQKNSQVLVKEPTFSFLIGLFNQYLGEHSKSEICLAFWDKFFLKNDQSAFLTFINDWQEEKCLKFISSRKETILLNQTIS